MKRRPDKSRTARRTELDRPLPLPAARMASGQSRLLTPEHGDVKRMTRLRGMLGRKVSKVNVNAAP